MSSKLYRKLCDPLIGQLIATRGWSDVIGSRMGTSLADVVEQDLITRYKSQGIDDIRYTYCQTPNH